MVSVISVVLSSVDSPSHHGLDLVGSSKVARKVVELGSSVFYTKKDCRDSQVEIPKVLSHEMSPGQYFLKIVLLSLSL